ncbi:hypothetical protein RISK_005217 [Rhodopirellula islandica]|uniref:Uncharacterized protein n=1 Tax=Rhodopirellula islandica TaxID=595434 RepID=A0A0J1B902_RHOIS|nr:hypothetical protein RISK_005217 [Rhodopirellula islandica]
MVLSACVDVLPVDLNGVSNLHSVFATKSTQADGALNLFFRRMKDLAY